MNDLVQCHQEETTKLCNVKRVRVVDTPVIDDDETNSKRHCATATENEEEVSHTKVRMAQWWYYLDQSQTPQGHITIVAERSVAILIHPLGRSLLSRPDAGLA